MRPYHGDGTAHVRPPPTPRRVLWARCAGVTQERQLCASRDTDSLPKWEGGGRLATELAALRALDTTIRDWRRLEPARIRELARRAQERAEDRRLLVTAVFVGTVQACMFGDYRAPSWEDARSIEVKCGHFASPMSRMCMPGSSSVAAAAVAAVVIDGGEDASARVTCVPRCHPLDASAQLQRSGKHLRVAVVHFSGSQDPRNGDVRHMHMRDDQLFLRTTYYQAFERLESHIHRPLNDVLASGGLIYTPGVALLRGPLDDGAVWLEDPTRADIIWTGFAPSPQFEEQGQYFLEREKIAMEATVDAIFSTAASNGVEALVMPPLACGTHGCNHPALDVASILHAAVDRYRCCIPEVVIASDHLAHFQDGWWEAFTDAVHHGRPPILRQVKAPIPGFPQLRKDRLALAEKNRIASRVSPREKRYTFL